MIKRIVAENADKLNQINMYCADWKFTRAYGLFVVLDIIKAL